MLQVRLLRTVVVLAATALLMASSCSWRIGTPIPQGVPPPPGDPVPNIDTHAAGCAKHLVGKGERAGIEHMIGAQQAHEIALLLGAGGGEDFRAQMFRELDRGDAHAAGAAVDEHPLTLT